MLLSLPIKILIIFSILLWHSKNIFSAEIRKVYEIPLPIVYLKFKLKIKQLSITYTGLAKSLDTLL